MLGRVFGFTRADIATGGRAVPKLERDECGCGREPYTDGVMCPECNAIYMREMGLDAPMAAVNVFAALNIENRLAETPPT
jgi:hypothetical protein